MGSDLHSMRQTLRVGDEERHQTSEILGVHLAHGRITREEFQQRLDQALTAKTAAELAELVADLPVPDASRHTTAQNKHRRGALTVIDPRRFQPVVILAVFVLVAGIAGFNILPMRSADGEVLAFFYMLGAELGGALVGGLWVRTLHRRKDNDVE